MARRPVASARAPGPNEMRDPLFRAELKRAGVWFGLAIAIGLIVLMVQPLLIIFGGLVFASILDGGTRLLGRALPIARGWRLLLVILFAVGFVAMVIYLTGVQVAIQAEQLRTTLEVQTARLTAWLTSLGVMPGPSDLTGLAKQALSSVGKVTSAVGSALGALTSLFMILVLGVFIAMEPRLYHRGLAWMVPIDARDEFAVTTTRMAQTLRTLMAGRIMGMAFEGVLTWICLWIAGVPMALLLGILTGMLAFIPNIGAFISGVLMVAVGFSAGYDTGIGAIIVYFAVQTFDGYVLLPIVARRTVDMPPALTLASQLLFGSLFGIMGLALADPMTAMIKVFLERRSERAVQDDLDAEASSSKTAR